MITRRRLLSSAAAAAAGAALSACGVKGKGRASPGLGPLPPRAGKLEFANWPLYIDVDEKTGKRPSLEQFTAQTGIAVDYKEAISDNDPFFGTIRESLAQGRDTGWDLIVVTDWLVGRMVRLGYVEPLHYDKLPNVTANVGPIFAGSPGDPRDEHSVPWQAGITGIGYNPALTKRDITSFGDLFDPAFKGKIGMLSDMRDMVHLTLMWQGIDPASATMADVRGAVAKLVAQRKQGLVRGYYENDYTDALAKGDLAITLAYSGDVLQLQASNPNLKFVVPSEGGMLWVDSMVVPFHADHPEDAHELMNFVYRPSVAAQIAETVQFITPVPAARGVMLDEAKAASGERRSTLQTLASSPLVFPPSDVQGRLHRYRILSEEEEKQWNDAFSAVVVG